MENFEELASRGHVIVDVARLAVDGEQMKGEIPVAELDLDPDDFLFKPKSGLRYDLFVQLLGTELLVRGKVSQDFLCMCVRCGEDFDWTAADDEVTFSLETEVDAFSDLTSELRQAIILSFPSNPICKEDCKGVCPHCGADLNKGPCSCKPTQGDIRWGALDELK